MSGLTRSLLSVLTVLVFVLGLQSAALAGPTSFTSDDFNSHNLNRTLWTYVDPLGDCALAMTGVNTDNAWLSITAPAGVQHDIWTDGYNAPRIMQPCTNTDFTIEAKFISGVSGHWPDYFRTEGIVVEADPTHVIRFDFTTGELDSMKIFCAIFQGGFSSPSQQVFKGIAHQGVAPLWMRVNRTGNVFTLSYSFDGSVYTTAVSFTHAMTVSKVGLFAGNAGSSVQENTVIADYFFNVDSPIAPEDGARNVPDRTAPMIHGVQYRAAANAIEVTWNTDEPTNGVVEYGSSPSYGQSVPSFAHSYTHPTTFGALDPNTLYNFRISATDDSSNTAVSGNYTGTTGVYSTDLSSTSDDFNAASLNTGLWQFVNPRGDATVAVSNNQVTLTVPGGINHDLWSTGNYLPRIMQTVSDGDFSVTAKFNSGMTSNGSSYPMQGILVQGDSLNLMRFDFSDVGSGTRAFAITFIDGLSNPTTQLDVPVGASGVAPTYMRIGRSGALWIMDYSFNGSTWTNAGSFYQIMHVSKVGVTAGNAGSQPATVSVQVDFFKAALPAKPLLASPANVSTGVLTSPTLTWYTATGASTYRLQVATDTLFNSVVYNDSTLLDTTKQVSGLNTLTKYFWRVRSKSGLGIGAFSNAFSFTTISGLPSVPTLVSPGTGTTNQPVSLTLRWNAAQFASSYRVQVSTDSTFAGGLVVNDSTVTDTTKAVSGLANNTKYFWRVNAKSAAGSSAYSTVWNFSTIIAASTAPVLVAPADGASNQAVSLLLKWTRPVNATSFRLQVSTDNTFAGGFIVNDSTITDTSKQVTGLSYAGHYYWRVNAKNAGGTSPYSAVWSFFTYLQDPSIPVPLAPANNATNVPSSPTIQWSKPVGATSYHLQLGTDSTFAGGLIINDATLTDTFKVASNLSYLTKYFWRVNADNVGGTTPYSATWKFTTGIPLPSQVQLLAPRDSGYATKDSVKLLWRMSGPNVSKYYIDIATDAAFQFSRTDSTLGDTTKVIHGLTDKLTYFWRVRAYNPGGWGPNSAVRAIKVDFTVSVAEKGELPKTFALSQNYPNPFNPTTQIEFGLPKESHVKLEIYNLIGEKVATLVDETRATGFYTVSFNASELSSGLYFYRLSTGATSIVKKMMLLK